jgi:thiol-disulfide isomerase/thioredoxin
MRSFIVLIFLFTFVSCQAQQQAASLPPPPPAEAAADIPIYDSFDQLAHIFQKQNDTTYLINFWATWCKPCVEELPYIEQLHDDFSGKKLSIILVSLDFPEQIDTKLRPFVSARALRSQVVALTDGNYNAWIDRVEPSWGGAIPVTLIYNSEKRVFIDKPVKQYEDLKSVVSSFF